MATRLDKSEPSKLAFRLNPPGAVGATLQVAQDFSVTVGVMAGETEHARYKANEPGRLHAPEGGWLAGARLTVLAERDGPHQRHGLIAVPARDANYYLGLPIGGFTIGEDSHPDPASAWDLATAGFSVPVAEIGEVESSTL